MNWAELQTALGVTSIKGIASELRIGKRRLPKKSEMGDPVPDTVMDLARDKLNGELEGACKPDVDVAPQKSNGNGGVQATLSPTADDSPPPEDATEPSQNDLLIKARAQMDTWDDAPSPEEIEAFFLDLINDGMVPSTGEIVVKQLLRKWKDDLPSANTLKGTWRDLDTEQQRTALAEAGYDEDEIALQEALEEWEIADPEPWERQVDGKKLAAEIEATFRRHITADEDVYTILTLWPFHTYCLGMSFCRVSPRLALTSPQKQCAKTTTMDITLEFCWRPIASSDLTNAGIFRIANMLKCTLGIDERDRGSREGVDTLLNDGWSRSKRRVVIRNEKDADGNYRPRPFRIFIPIILAGIGGVGTDTLHDRCLEARLQRQTEEEAKERTPVTDEVLDALGDVPRRKILRWIQDNEDALNAAPRPEIPGLANRPLDNWAILYAIAHVIGGKWPQRVRDAVKHAMAATKPIEHETSPIAMVTDIIRIAEDVAAQLRERHRQDVQWYDLVIPSEDLGHALATLDDSKWTESDRSRGKVSPKYIGSLLRRFEVHTVRETEYVSLKHSKYSVQVLVPSKKDRVRCYHMKDFVDLRKRYVSIADVTPI